MQKIKFKIEYKPLSEAEISKHKNFDVLMKAYVAAPKPNFIKRFLNNKWMLFTGGILSGAAITALILTNTDTNNTVISVADKNETTIQSNTALQNETFTTADEMKTLEENNPVGKKKIYTGEEKKAITKSDVAQKNAKTAPVQIAEVKSETTDIKNNEEEVTEDVNGSKAIKTNIEIATAKSTAKEKEEALINKAVASEVVAPAVNDVTVAENILPDVLSEINDNSGKQPENSIISGENNIISSDEQINAAVAEENTTLEQSDIEKVSDNNNSGIQTNTADTEKVKKQKPEKVKLPKEEKQAKEEKIKKDTAQQITFANKIENWKLFNKNTDTISAENADTISGMKSDTNDFVNRYAQLSFFTPLSTNGIDGYKYRHHLSVNILQGYNGALKGVEGAGIANIEKGYAIGVQGAGVANVIGGDLTGVQGAGVFNIARNVKGLQGAGVANLSGGSVTGAQGAGVINVSIKDVHGLQGAGVANIITTKDSSAFLQAAGVINFSLADANGMQAAGVLNIANKMHGSQIGLINVAKKMDGIQFGLINIADTLNGAAIGLISYSRNGIFDLSISTNDFFTFNAELRTGGPRIYNIFAFGLAPLNDTMRYGYGIGIGGEIPFNKFAVDIDAIGWDVHEDNFEFNYNNSFHMINQLRIMPAYKLNKYISFYAGPVLNVEIYNNSLSPFNDNPIAEYAGSNATTNLSIGYVAGVRFF